MRKKSLEELVNQLDSSRPAFADRLRYGTRNLLESTIAYHVPSDDVDE
ncbi:MULTISPECIES: hypothetical protein [Halorussus]